MSRDAGARGSPIIALDSEARRAADRPVSLIRSLLEELVPYRAVGRGMRRYGRAGDGGYVLVDDPAPGPLYSFGVGGDVSFEVAFADAHGVPVYLHDPTVAGPPARHPRFVFRRRGLGLERRDRWLRELVGVGQTIAHALDPWLAPWPARLTRRALGVAPIDGLARCVARNGDAGRRDLVLKVDVEGAEYEAFASAGLLACFRQIVVELHGLGVATHAALETQIAVLRRLGAGHALVHAHYNNFERMVRVEGYRVPRVLELTWLRRDPGLAFELATDPLPGPLDFPNFATKPDAALDFWPFPSARAESP